MFDHPLAGRVVAGIFRSRDDRRLQRWSELTSELLEILADAPIDDPPAERLLSTLGRRLDWDVTTLWALSAGAGSRLPPRLDAHADASRPPSPRRRRRDPTSGSEGLPQWVMEHGEPIWVPDLVARPPLHDRRAGQDGLQSAYAFPIRYRGSVRRGRQDAEPPRSASATPRSSSSWMRSASHLGELLHASAQAAEREHLVDELLEVAAAQRVPAPGDAGALRGRRLPRDGGAPGPGLGPGDGRPVPDRHRGRGRADAADGRLACRPREAGAHRGAAHQVPARPGWHPSDHRGHAQRPLHVERVHGRRVPEGDQPGRPALRDPQGRSVSPRT